MAYQNQDQPIDLSPVQRANLLSEDGITQDNLVPYIMSDSEPQMIKEIPTTVNPPVLFENLDVGCKNGNEPEKAVEEFNGQMQQQ